MELELLKKDENSIMVKIIGEDHTLCNVLRKALYEDKHVASASYVIEHPILEHPKFYVKVKKGRSPRRALTDAAGRVIESCEELRKDLLKLRKKK
jgi:DNA-directed RNA polymerase subunit L